MGTASSAFRRGESRVRPRCVARSGTWHHRAVTAPRDPVADLRRIAFLLERAHESTYRVRAFRGAAAALRARDRDELAALAASGELRRLRGVGDVTARCVVESLAGEEPAYLSKLSAIEGSVLADAATGLRAQLRGDCHSHTDASDGGSPLAEMVETARELGHDYLVITDHSPRLTVANGLSAERLRAQIRDVAELNLALSGIQRRHPFAICHGRFCDDGVTAFNKTRVLCGEGPRSVRLLI